LALSVLGSYFSVHSAQATIAGIETAHMIRKGQLSEENIPAYKQICTNFRIAAHNAVLSQA
jgi:transposase-like protein